MTKEEIREKEIAILFREVEAMREAIASLKSDITWLHRRIDEMRSARTLK